MKWKQYLVSIIQRQRPFFWRHLWNNKRGIKSNPANCGKSPEITWVAYYAKVGAETLTCENYQQKLDEYSTSPETSNYSFLNEEAEPWNNPSYCLADLSSDFWQPVNHATTYNIVCNDVPETTTQATTTTTQTTTAEVVTTTEAPTTAAETTPSVTMAPKPRPTAMVDDSADGCCDQHLVDINILVSSGQTADVGVPLVQYGTNVDLGNKHKYSADLSGTMFGSQSDQNGFGSKVFLLPYEYQEDSANCGTSTDVTWALFFANSEDELNWHTDTCATHTGTSVVMLAENVETAAMGISCPLDSTAAWLPAPSDQSYNLYCGDVQERQYKAYSRQ